MSRPLALRILPPVPVQDWGGLGAALIERRRHDPDGPPELLVARLAGEAVLLGRWQRARSAVADPKRAVRRLGGGRATRAGEGTLGVLLSVPPAGLSEPIAPDRVLNRTVRGLRIGLEHLGARGAAYLGRDRIVATGRTVALLSQEGTPAGAAVLEALVGLERPLALAPGDDRYPEHSDPRAAGAPAASLAELGAALPSLEAIAGAVAEGYARLHGLDVVTAEGTIDAAAALSPAVLEDETGLERSGVADVPIGFVEALVRVEGDRVAAVRIRGDFLAPAFWVQDVEQRLAGCPLVFEELGRRIDQAFRAPGVFLHGVVKLRVFADAVLAARP